MRGELFDELPRLVTRHALEAVRVERIDEENGPPGHGMRDDGRTGLLGIGPIEPLLGIALVESHPGGTVVAAV